MAINRDKVLEAAQKYVEKKKYDKAIVEYQKLIAADPSDARTLLKVGDLQARLSTYAEAVATYESVAKLYAQQGFALKSIAVYKQIREIVGKHVPQLEDRYAHVSPKLAELYQQLGLTSDALATLDEVATRLQRQQRDSEAVEIFRRIVELDPSNPLPHLRLAEALSRAGDTEGAIYEFSTAATQLSAIGRRDDALKVFERLLHHRPDPEHAKGAASLYLERGQPQDGMQALSKLQIAFQANPRDYDTLSLLARAFTTIGQVAKAIEVQKEMARVARDSGNADLFREIVERLMRVAPRDEGVRKLATQTGALPAPPPPAVPAPAPQGFAEGPVSGAANDAAHAGSGAVARPRAPSYAEPAGLGGAQPVARRTESQLHGPPPMGRPLPGAMPAQGAPRPPPQPPVRVPSQPHFAQETVPDVDAEEVDADEVVEELDADELIEAGPSAVPEPRIARTYELADESEAVPATYDLGDVAEQADPDALTGEVEADAYVDEAAPALDPAEAVAKCIEEASTFRRVRLFAKAIEILQGGLAIDPRSMDLHELYRDVLIEAGETYDAVDEMLAIASIYVEALDSESAVRALQDVLQFDPQNEQALAMLQDLGYEVIDEQGEASEAVPQEAPLPAFELEEPAASHAEYTEPGGELEAEEEGAHPGYDEDGQTRFGEAPALAAEVGESLPSFPLEEPEQLHVAKAPPPKPEAAAPRAIRPGIGQDSKPLAEAPKPAAKAAAPSPAPIPSPAAARPVEPQASAQELEDALDEAEFFCSRGLYEDACAILDDQLAKHPGHPLLLERRSEIEAHLGTRSDAERERARPETPVFDIGSSLDALEGFEGMVPAEGHAEEGEQVDVEEVFAKFKEGVAAQISVDDSDSHYNLGIAYKEMLLIDDAIREFDVAARDPKRECVCRSMIGMIQLERGNLNEAIEAFLAGLNATVKNPQQETVLCYEIGAAYETKKMLKDALSYFQKAMRRDPNYRDVQERVRRLAKSEPRVPMKAAAGADDEFDRAFDDLLSKA